MTHSFEEHNFLPSGMKMSMMNRDRNSTDKLLLIVLFICVMIWIPTIIYAQLACEKECYTFFDKLIGKSENFFDTTRVLIIIGFILLCGLYTRLIFGMMLFFPKSTRLSFLVLWLLPITFIFLFSYQQIIFIVYMLIASICSLILVHYLLRTEWFHLSDAILKESCKAIVYFPSVSIITALCYTLAICIAYVMFATFVNLESMDGFVFIFHVINSFVGMWVILFIVMFGQMVLCGTFATWYWNEKRGLVPKYTVFRCLKIVLRYHLGTVAYASSVFGVFDILYQLAMRIVYRKENKSTINWLIVYHMFDSVVCRYVATGAIVKCISEGKKFSDSAETAIDYFEKFPKKCLITTKIIETMMLFSMLVVQLLMAFSTFPYFNYLPMSLEADYTFTLFVTVGSWLFIYSLLATLHASFNTILISCLEDWKTNDGGEYKPYAMNEELRVALTRSGSPEWYQSLMCCCNNRQTSI